MFYFLKNLLYVIIVYYLIFKNLSNFKIFLLLLFYYILMIIHIKEKLKTKKCMKTKNVKQ